MIQLDVQTALRQSEMKEEVYAKQPVGFEKLHLNGQPHVCMLKKSLSGLKQSPRNWHGTIQHELITEGFKACMCDPCVYVKDESSSLACRHMVVRSGLVFQNRPVVLHIPLPSSNSKGMLSVHRAESHSSRGWQRWPTLGMRQTGAYVLPKSVPAT